MPSISWSAPVPTAAKYPHNMMLPPLCSTVGMVFFGLQASSFSSKHNNGHYGQTVLFLFHQTRGHFYKKYDLCPHAQLQTVVCLFYGGFGAVASSMLSSLSGYVDIGTVPVSSSIFTRSFAVVLGLICTFHTKVRWSLVNRTRLLPEGYDGCMVPWCYTCVLLFVQINVVPSGVWKLLPRMNQTCGGLQLSFQGLGWFSLIFPWCQAKTLLVWR